MRGDGRLQAHIGKPGNPNPALRGAGAAMCRQFPTAVGAVREHLPESHASPGRHLEGAGTLPVLR